MLEKTAVLQEHNLHKGESFSKKPIDIARVYCSNGGVWFISCVVEGGYIFNVKC